MADRINPDREGTDEMNDRNHGFVPSFYNSHRHNQGTPTPDLRPQNLSHLQMYQAMKNGVVGVGNGEHSLSHHSPALSGNVDSNSDYDCHPIPSSNVPLHGTSHDLNNAFSSSRRESCHTSPREPQNANNLSASYISTKSRPPHHRFISPGTMAKDFNGGEVSNNGLRENSPAARNDANASASNDNSRNLQYPMRVSDGRPDKSPVPTVDTNGT